MLDGQIIDRIVPWLDFDKAEATGGNASTWEEIGLKPDAPEDAKLAFARYLELEQKSRETGVRY